MALLVWLPLNGDLKNNGLTDITLTNHGATVENNGKIGKCYSFDGVDDYITTTYSTAIGMADFSIAMWVKIPTLTSGSYYAICTSKSAAAASAGFGIYWNYSQKKFLWSTADGSNATEIWMANTVDTIVYDKWIHLVMVRNSADSKKGYFYINAVRYELNSIPVIRDITTDTKLYIGRCTNNYYSAKMYLNDFRIYNHALSPKEVKEISKGLILHYPLDSLQVNPVNNLVIGITAGGQTTKLTDGRIGVITSGTNADTYFTINLSENIVKDTKYTLICYAEGISTGAYWGFPLGTQNNSALPFKIYNGYNEYTFVANDINWGSLRLFMDDLGRADWANRATFWGFQLYKNPVFNIIDESGYGHHGTLYGNVVLNTNSARYTHSSYLTNGQTDYIQTNSGCGNPSDAITMNIWFKSSNTSPGSSYHHMFNGLTSWTYIEMAVHKDGYLRCGLYIGGTRYVANCGSGLLDGNWHMLTMTYDGANVKRYIDGVLSNTLAATGNIDRPNDTFIFGHGTSTGYYCKETYLSDARLYATALSADDIKELYNTPAFIDNKLNLSAYELIEDNNAEVRKTGILEGVSFYESGTDALHYDTKIYTEPDGSKWAHIAHHNNPAGGVFPSNSKWNLGVYVDTNRWYDVEQIVAISDKYEFMVKQKPTSDGTEVKYRWILTVSPLIATWNDVKPGTVTNITTSGYTNGGNGGMYIANNKTHVCIANSSSGDWWGGIGTYTAYQGGIPGYPRVVVTTGYEDLYIRIYPEVLIYNSGQIKSNTFYEI